jgi:uncharacterized membrane protein
MGQAVTTGLLFALTKPIAAIFVGLAGVCTLLLRLQAREQPRIAWNEYVSYLHPFLLIGLLVSAAAVGGVI